VFTLSALGGCFLATAVSLFAPLLLRVLTTAAYYPAYTSVPFLAFGYLAMGAMYITALGANLAKKSMPVAVSIFIGALVNTVLNLALIPVLGKEGAAIATFVAYVAVAAYLYRASQRLYPIPYRPLQVLACLGLSAALISLDRLLLPSSTAISYLVRSLLCLTFVPLAFGLGVLRPEHIAAGRRYLAARLARPRSS
jgi:O-antigen/teichoic acid export membrane protein